MHGALKTLALLGAGLAGCGTPLVVQGETVDAAALAAVECVAVLPFVNVTATENAGALVAQELAQQLLTSARFNILTPTETAHLLSLVPVPGAPSADPKRVLELGKHLGVQAVLAGVVHEYAPRNVTGASRGLLAFTAHLVDVSSGRIVWTSMASHFEHQPWLRMPEPQRTLVQETAVAIAHELDDGRKASRGLCAAIYANLTEGSVSKAPRTPAASAALTSPSPTSSEQRDDATAGLVSPDALPSLGSEPAADLPPIDALPPEPAADLPPIAGPPGRLPPLLSAARADVRKLATPLYRTGQTELRGAFPDYRKKTLVLSPKAKRFLQSVQQLLRLAPSLRLRLEIAVPSATVADVAARQQTLVQEFLAGAGVDPARLAVESVVGSGTKANKGSNVLRVVALAY